MRERTRRVAHTLGERYADPMLRAVESAQLEHLGSRDLSDALERGEILLFRTCPFPPPSEAALAFLREELPKHLDCKNVSFYATDSRLVGLGTDPALSARTRTIFRSHAQQVQAFLRRHMPEFTRGWTIGTTSFRPLQERDRDLSPHASNELVHVDAGAYGATHGQRVLRFFFNANPSKDRLWATRGTFGEILSRYAEAAQIRLPCQLTEGPLDRARTTLLSGLARQGFSRASMIDGSPYDRVMRRLHNFMKDDLRFREGRDGYEEFAFPPFSAWCVLTDGVSHACLSGQHALVDTFLIPLASCHHPELAPIQLLQQAPSPVEQRAR